MRTRRTAGTDRDTERRSGLSDPRPPVVDGPGTPSQPSSSVRLFMRGAAQGRGSRRTSPGQLSIGAVGRGVADHQHDRAGQARALVSQLVGLVVTEADRVARGKSMLTEPDSERELSLQHEKQVAPRVPEELLAAGGAGFVSDLHEPSSRLVARQQVLPGHAPVQLDSLPIGRTNHPGGLTGHGLDVRRHVAEE